MILGIDLLIFLYHENVNFFNGFNVLYHVLKKPLYYFINFGQKH